jgi:pilus assembly protein Flp/PilA
MLRQIDQQTFPFSCNINEPTIMSACQDAMIWHLWSKRMFKTAIRFFKDESGATAIEYGLIVALISVAAIAAFTAVGTHLQSEFNTIASDV